ncbi:MAG: histidine phosphatase family protein [Alphaproteobacteria bacterium]
MSDFPGRSTVYLLRHGPTDWNAEGRVMGRRPVPLSADGDRQVRARAPALSRLGIGSIWTSPVRRARETADIVAEALGIDSVLELPDLTEVDYAEWEGRLFRELVAEPSFREHFVDPLHGRAPGGGESLHEVGERVGRALAAIRAASNGAPALVVSHGDPLRMMIAGAIGLEPGAMRRLRIDPAGLSALAFGGPWPELAFLNQAS